MHFLISQKFALHPLSLRVGVSVDKLGIAPSQAHLHPHTPLRDAPLDNIDMSVTDIFDT